MNENPLVSVIVPVYNKEKYIKKCLDSVCRQTYTNLEIILIDDGSKDKSLEICYNYAELDKRIRIIAQANAGPSAARNKGIDCSKGEYISFVDADDELEINAYENLIKNLLETQCNIAVMGMRYIYHEGTQDMVLRNYQSGILSRKEFLTRFFDDIIVCFSSVNKVYSRELIGETRFDTNLKMSEDQKFVYQLLKKVDYLVYDEKVYYNIYFTDASLSRTTTTRYHLAQLDVNEYIINDLDDETIKKKANLYNVDLCLSVFVPYYKNNDFLKEDRERITRIINKNKKIVFDNGNKTIKIKMILYMLSDNLLKKILLFKRKIQRKVI